MEEPTEKGEEEVEEKPEEKPKVEEKPKPEVEEKPKEKPTSPEYCPKCHSDNTTILRKEPSVAYGHRITRKCNSCGHSWSYTSRYGAGSWI